MEAKTNGHDYAGRFASKPFALQVKLSKRSWWEVMFLGGATLGEWQTADVKRGFVLPLPWLQARTKWEDVDHSKVVAARLWCPNGEMAEVRSTGPNRVIQFKVGGVSTAGPWIEGHVLGVLTDDQGGCDCWMWYVAGGRLIRFQDNILTMHERFKVGPFSIEALDLKL